MGNETLSSLLSVIKKIFRFGNSKKLPENFEYRKTIYNYNFDSVYNLGLTASIEVVCDFIALSTTYNIKMLTSAIELEHQYYNDVKVIIDKHRLDLKEYANYQLVTWLHYYEQSSNSYYHYDKHIVYQYLELVDTFLDIYIDPISKDPKIPMSSMHGLIDHLVASSSCIKEYIINYDKNNTP